MMLSCWQVTPESRPLFDQLEDRIFEFINRHTSEHFIGFNGLDLLSVDGSR